MICTGRCGTTCETGRAGGRRLRTGNCWTDPVPVPVPDPGEVERIGMHGDPSCVRCRAGVDQALVGLGDRYPEYLVGILYWAGPATGTPHHL